MPRHSRSSLLLLVAAECALATSAEPPSRCTADSCPSDLEDASALQVKGAAREEESQGLASEAEHVHGSAPWYARGFNGQFLRKLQDYADTFHLSGDSLLRALEMLLGVSGGTFRLAKVARNDTGMQGRWLQTMDWRARGFNTPPGNQKGCGSCWAFSAAGMLTFARWKATGWKQAVELSTQQLVDCANLLGLDMGCRGGSPVTAMMYLMSTEGMYAEADYPYTARAGPCLSKSLMMQGKRPVATIPYRFLHALPISFVSVLNLAGSEHAMAEQILKSAMSVCVATELGGGANAWFQYTGHGGLLDCGGYTWPDHCVLLVGLHLAERGEDLAKESKAEEAPRSDGRGFTPPSRTKSYWIVKNQWGTRWGDGGYAYLEYDRNMCGIAMLATTAKARVL